MFSMACEVILKAMAMAMAMETVKRVGISKTPHAREGIMATILRKCIYPLLIAQATALLVFGPFCGAQQVSPAISSNLEQTAGTTSTRRSLSANSGPAVLPDDFAKLHLDTGYQLEMEVFGAQDTNSSLRVDEDGNVIVPFIGT